MYDQQHFWRALADPTRRAILDLLRRHKCTTTTLSEHFPHLTRFAVMKHLNVLQQAKLILVEREGKYRWNMLHAAPFQEVYERWVSPYHALWSGQLWSIKNYVQQKEQDVETIKSINIKVEVDLDCSRSRAWQAMTEDIQCWWHKDFYAIPDAIISLEPKVGGRLFERGKDGSEGLWYTLSAIYPERSLELVGHLRPEYGGPATSLLKWQLTDSSKGTRLVIEDSLFGVIGDNAEKNIGDGWRLLFEQGLGSYVAER